MFTLNWAKADVGCYWNAGRYHISTVMDGRHSYYRVAIGFDEIGSSKTLNGAKRIAKAHQRASVAASLSRCTIMADHAIKYTLAALRNKRESSNA